MIAKAIECSYDVFCLMSDISRRDREHFYALHLDPYLRVQRRELIAIGSLTEATIHPREVFRSAIRRGAFALIIAHNHPSGDPTPSDADIEITRQLCAAGEAVQIAVLDHVIVTRSRYSTISIKALAVPSWREQEVDLTVRTTSPPYSSPRAPRSAADWRAFIMGLRAPLLRSLPWGDEIAQSKSMPN